MSCTAIPDRSRQAARPSGRRQRDSLPCHTAPASRSSPQPSSGYAVGPAAQRRSARPACRPVLLPLSLLKLVPEPELRVQREALELIEQQLERIAHFNIAHVRVLAAHAARDLVPELIAHRNKAALLAHRHHRPVRIKAL